jgi:hypothetical protein
VDEPVDEQGAYAMKLASPNDLVPAIHWCVHQPARQQAGNSPAVLDTAQHTACGRLSSTLLNMSMQDTFGWICVACAVKHVRLNPLHDCTAASRRFAAGAMMHAREDRDALAEHERFVGVLVQTCKLEHLMPLANLVPLVWLVAAQCR